MVERTEPLDLRKHFGEKEPTQEEIIAFIELLTERNLAATKLNIENSRKQSWWSKIAVVAACMVAFFMFILQRQISDRNQITQQLKNQQIKNQTILEESRDDSRAARRELAAALQSSAQPNPAIAKALRQIDENTDMLQRICEEVNCQTASLAIPATPARKASAPTTTNPTTTTAPKG